MEVRFEIPGEPCGKGRPRFVGTGKPITPKRTENYETMVRWYYQMSANGFMFPDNAMLEMKIDAFYGVAKSDSKKKRDLKLRQCIRPTKKPDADNVGKIIADSCNDVAYHDDTQIVDMTIRKFYSDRPRVEVIIKDASPVENECC